MVTIANHFNFVSMLYIERGISLMLGICHVASCRAASSVDSVTDYNGFYCILSRRNAILASGVDRGAQGFPTGEVAAH